MKIKLAVLLSPLIFLLGCENAEHAQNSEATLNARDVAEPAAPIQPNPDRLLFATRWYRGAVCEVGPDWVELSAGWEWVNSVEFAWGSRDVIHREVYDNSKPLRISAAGTRPGGALDCEPFLPPCIPEETHLASEVRVGDLVSASVGRTRDGKEWALSLSIDRRPRSLIPPMHADKNLGTSQAAHLKLQAEQDWEEKGVPIPKEYLDSQGRYPGVKPPYPPAAPEPRAAKPKP